MSFRPEFYMQHPNEVRKLPHEQQLRYLGYFIQRTQFSMKDADTSELDHVFTNLLLELTPETSAYVLQECIHSHSASALSYFIEQGITVHVLIEKQPALNYTGTRLEDYKKSMTPKLVEETNYLYATLQEVYDLLFEAVMTTGNYKEGEVN